MWLALFLSLLLIPSPVLACKCQASFSACNEVAQSEVVFIGTVESVGPGILDSWNPSQHSLLLLLNEETARLQEDHSPSSLARLKDAYLKIFSDLPEDYRRQLQAADTHSALVTLFYSILGHGRRTRFKVRTVFRGEEEDFLEVWTPFGDCGYDFQKGETYLVYADSDEGTDIIETNSCSRTRRLSDAGEDLAYLFFFQNGGDQSARLEGFVTSDVLYQLDQDPLHDPKKVKYPAPGVVLVVESPRGTLHAETDQAGRFVFDGLAEGDYTVTVFDSGYPADARRLAGPKQFHVKAKACVNTILLAPKRPPEQ